MAMRFLDEIILDLFSRAYTEKGQKKNRNHDLSKCHQEITFEIYAKKVKFRMYAKKVKVRFRDLRYKLFKKNNNFRQTRPC